MFFPGLLEPNPRLGFLIVNSQRNIDLEGHLGLWTSFVEQGGQSAKVPCETVVAFLSLLIIK